jgi:hypothetical protein
MKTILVRVSTDKVGSECTAEIEVGEDMTDVQIEAEAREAMFEMIEWSWTVTDG